MIAPDHPSIPEAWSSLKRLIDAHGVEQWTNGKAAEPTLDSLVYLCKFGFFTGILTKAQIGRTLGLDRAELKAMVKGWYDDHRAKGCGTC